MFRRLLRGTVLACGMTAALLAVPSQGMAFPWLDRLMGWGEYSTSYQTYQVPVTYAAPAYGGSCCYRPSSPCNPCGNACGYAPRTCYRTVVRRVPVTTYYVAPRCSSCTSGCCTTTCLPNACSTCRPQSVPYTTTCRGFRSVPTCVNGCSAPAGSVPVYPTSNIGGPLQPTPEPALQPVPNSGMQSPSGLAPGPTNTDDRTAQQPTPLFHLVTRPVEPVSAHPVAQTSSGWRASRD